MSRISRRAALGAAASALTIVAAGAAQAQSAAVDDVVVVTGRSLEMTLPQELAAYGSDLVTVDSEAIQKNVYIDAHQALQTQAPGLYISPRGPFAYSDVSLQGSRTGDVLWLVDGVRINNRLYPGTVTDTLPASMIERIEVLKGGEALFYGTQAGGGVINVVTREFTDEFGGDIRIGGDTNSSSSLSAMVRGPAGPGHFVVYASRDQSDGITPYSAFEPSATMRKRPYEVLSFGGKYGISFTDDLSLTAQYQHTEADLGYPSPTLTAFSSNDRDEEIASVRLDYTPSDTAQFFIKGYFHDWDTIYTTVQNVIGSPGQTVVADDHLYWGYEDYGINALGKFRVVEGFETLLGYDFQNYTAQDEVWLIAEETEQVHAVFGQLRTTEDLIENGMFAIGVRHNETEGNSATVYSATGRYNVSDTLYIQGQAGTNFNLPSAEQLYLREPCCETGNPNLEPEESVNFNASLGGQTDRFYWQTTYFWREIDNRIDYFYDDPAFPNGTFHNSDVKVKIRGFELIGGVSLTDALRAEASYTDTRSREAGSDLQIDRIPRRQAKASLTYDSGWFGGTLATRWVGDVYSSRRLPSRSNYGDYVVADLSGFVYLDQDQHHQITARLENAFDKDYAVILSGYPRDNGMGNFASKTLAAGRTLHMAYRYAF